MQIIHFKLEFNWWQLPLNFAPWYLPVLMTDLIWKVSSTLDKTKRIQEFSVEAQNSQVHLSVHDKSGQLEKAWDGVPCVFVDCRLNWWGKCVVFVWKAAMLCNLLSIMQVFMWKAAMFFVQLVKLASCKTVHVNWCADVNGICVPILFFLKKVVLNIFDLKVTTSEQTTRVHASWWLNFICI